MGRHADAIADYDQAIHLKPDYAEAYGNRGSAKGALGQYQDAISDYGETICLKPNDAITHFNRGGAKYSLGLKDKARKDFETALELARKAGMQDVLAAAEQALRDLNDAEGS